MQEKFAPRSRETEKSLFFAKEAAVSDVPSEEIVEKVRHCMSATMARPVHRVQSLWSGYGSIWRFELRGAAAQSVILKSVTPPSARRHPRGWTSDVSHQRKLRSYEVEKNWYQNFTERCNEICRVPGVELLENVGDSWLFVLEDLNAAGFSERPSLLNEAEILACITWLARFHARFLFSKPEGLWDVGTYWELGTRPEELSVMRDESLRRAAPLLDAALNGAKYQTFVHGDAKIANFCFPERDADSACAAVAAVDFQYVGGGVGVKDLAYFLSSCFDERGLQKYATRWCDEYFSLLVAAIEREHASVDARAVEAEWRTLYPVAWGDFVRFLNGWAPGHSKLHGYSLTMTQTALAQV